MKYLIILLALMVSINCLGQYQSGYYMNWNVNHSEIKIQPSIPLEEEEARRVACYLVTFNKQGQLERVKYFINGVPNDHSNYGAYQLIRTYTKNTLIESFIDSKGNRTTNSNGVAYYKYILNDKGYWERKERYDQHDVSIEEGKVAVNIVSRNEQNEMATEVQLNLNQDTIPDINGFKVVHFAYNEDGFVKYRQHRNGQGTLINGDLGYAIVNFQFDHNGMFFEEEFRDQENNLVVHPRLLFARVNFRAFNQYGLFQRVYYMDEKGYPDQDRAYAEVEYHANMTRRKVTFFDREGELTEDPRGIAYGIFNYDDTGKPLGRTNFNLKGEQVK